MKGPTMDPVTFSIIRHRLFRVVEEAVITLKQGAGRLIRAETDRGVLMICDTRLVDKPYGRRIWQSLPPFKRTREIDVVREFFEERTASPAGGSSD